MAVLSGLRVVEVSASGAAATAGKHFADWGAEVVILEPPGGTPLRQEPPYYEIDGQQMSGAWEWLSRGKTTLRLNHDDATALCAAADIVLLEGELADGVLGESARTLREQSPAGNTWVIISPFPLDGPLGSYRASDLGVQARGGWMFREGLRQPIRPGLAMAARIAGAWAFLASLASHRYAQAGGRRQVIEIPMQAVASWMLVSPWLVRSMTGVERMGGAAGGFPQVLQCKDGWFGCAAVAGHEEDMYRFLGIGDLLEIPGAATPEYRSTHAAEILERIRPFLMSHTRQELMEMAQAAGMTGAPVDNVAERLEDAHLLSRGFFDAIQLHGREVRVPRVPYLISDLQPVERRPLKDGSRPAWQRPGNSNGAGAAPGLPYSGIRILDVTHHWSGPTSTQNLAMLGADVIHVESVQRPDIFRYTAAVPNGEALWECGPLWNDSNQSKRDLTLDLTSAAGKDLFLRLVKTADIVVSNFSNRVMPRLGLTADVLLSVNPRLIVVTLPGFGLGGLWENYIGFGTAFEYMVCGSWHGYPDGPPQAMAGYSDLGSAIHADIAIELALWKRDQTGKGSVVEIPQSEIADSLLAPEHIAVQMGAPVPARRANRHEWMAPHNTYRVGGADDWIAIAVASDAEFAALAGEIGLPGLKDEPRFVSASARKANEEALDEIIGGAVRQESLLELEARLQARGVMACRVTRPTRLTDDESLQHFSFFKELSRPAAGTHPHKGLPLRFSSIQPVRRASPVLGRDNEAILGELGLQPDQLDSLRAQQVIGTTPLRPAAHS